MSGIDFYQLLGVPREATDTEVKKAYRRRALEHHPDRMVDADEAQREWAEEFIRLLNEGYAVLQDPDRRRLYDHCLLTGKDFAAQEAAARPESEAERQAREAADHAFERAVRAAVEVAVNAIRALDDFVEWRQEVDHDPYFDAVLLGARGSQRHRVHLKILEELSPDDVPGIDAYARGMLETVRPGLVREQHAYLMLSRSLRDERVTRNRIELFNRRHWSRARPRAPRAFIACGSVVEGRVQVPGLEDTEPDLGELRLPLARLFAF